MLINLSLFLLNSHIALNCNKLREKSKVCIEGITLGDDPTEASYIVQKNDSCKSIAEKLNTKVRILKNYSYGKYNKF